MINLQPLNSKEYLITEIQKIFIMEKIKKETMKDVSYLRILRGELVLP